MNDVIGGDRVNALIKKLLSAKPGASEPLSFAPNAQRVLEKMVDGILDPDELFLVVSQLRAAMVTLEHESSCPAAARVIARVVEREEVTRRLVGVTASWRVEAGQHTLVSAMSRAEDIARALGKFYGVKSAFLAPQHDSLPPAGTFRASRFVVPRRLG